MGVRGGICHQKLRQVIDGHIIDATLEGANQAIVKLWYFNSLVDVQMISLADMGMIMSQCTSNCVVFLAAEGWVIA